MHKKLYREQGGDKGEHSEKEGFWEFKKLIGVLKIFPKGGISPKKLPSLWHLIGDQSRNCISSTENTTIGWKYKKLTEHQL